LLHVTCLERADEYATHFQKLVEVFGAGVRASAQVDPVVAHTLFNIQLVHIAERETNLRLPDFLTTLPSVLDSVWPNLDAI
jgi:hypothetical protein